MRNKELFVNESIAIIMAAESGYAHDGFEKAGYSVYCSYKHVGFFLRCIRELYFKIPFLPQTLWYDKKIEKIQPKYIIVRDAIISRKYLLWLQSVFPNAQINFMYENMIGKAKHIIPSMIPDGIRVWTYDKFDSQKYEIRLKKSLPYFSEFVVDKGTTIYDVLFVGRDKGRGDWLHEFECFLNKRGYKTKFVITADSKYSKRKPYYQNEVSYNTIAEWMSHTKCIINVGMKNQQGITIRDLECLFNKIKLITTNEHIKEAYFYNPDNIFVLNENNWEDVPEFLNKKYNDGIEIDMDIHSVHTMVTEIIEAK